MDGHRHNDPGRFPVLDIGGEVGAVVVHLAAPPATGELHACPSSSPVLRSHFHTGVHHRHLDDGSASWVAIFPEVVEGAYHLLDEDGLGLAEVSVSGGEVETLDLR